MSDAEAEVLALVRDWENAYRDRDVDALSRLVIGDGLQLVGTGADEVRFGMDEYLFQARRDFSQLGDDAAFTFSNVHTTVLGDAAFVYCDASIAGTAGGQPFAMSGMRLTAGLVLTGEGWRAAQLHLSVPDGAQAEGNSFET